MILDEIIKYKKEFTATQANKTPLIEIKKACQDLPPALNFLEALKNRPVGLIAEIKKASPSKGLIRENFDVAEIAQIYQDSGVACVSCLTDEKYFQGSFATFQKARAILKKPMLRKDFTVDIYNVYETRLMGADAILLIASALSTQQMQEYYETATKLGLTTLFEVHDSDELNQVLNLKPQLVGINNRNLKTFETNIETSLTLSQRIPAEIYTISESALKNRNDIVTLKEAGVNGFLIGETFMRQKNIKESIDQLFPELI